MKIFTTRQIREAKEYSLAGGQALHVWQNPGGYPGAPLCFQRSKTWAHLMDQDKERLIATARRFGVRVIKVSNEGDRDQHIDLCGKPLQRAIEEARRTA